MGDIDPSPPVTCQTTDEQKQTDRLEARDNLIVIDIFIRHRWQKATKKRNSRKSNNKM